MKDHKNAKKIVLYFASNGPHAPPQQLIEQSKKTLPSYMVPALAIELEILPKTTSGKVDTKALPAPNFEDFRYLFPSKPPPPKPT